MQTNFAELENIKKSLLDRIKDLSYTGTNKAELRKYLQMYYEVKDAIRKEGGDNTPEPKSYTCNIHPYANLYRYNTEHYPLKVIDPVYRIEEREKL